MSNNYYEMISAVAAAIIATWGSIYIAIKTFNRTSYSTIHESTDWRKELMKIASKSTLEKNDIYRMRASVYSTKSNSHKIDLLTIEYTEYIVSKYDKLEPVFSEEDMEIGRIICRGLLHINWIYNTRPNKNRKEYDSEKIYENILNEIVIYKEDKNKFIEYVSDKIIEIN